MERVQDEIGTSIPAHNFASDFGLIDFMDEANFDQFIDLIRGDIQNDQAQEQAILNFNSNIQGYNFDQQNTTSSGVSNIIVDGQIFQPLDQLFNFDFANYEGHHVADPNNINNISGLISLQDARQEKADDDNYEDDEEIMDDQNESSTTDGTTTTTTAATTDRPAKKNSNKADRSRTLVSERRRRGRMKEKLYALRSLVPNITKMDKASIVGDAVLYVQDLQMQAKRLKAEIAGLESSLSGGDKFEGTQNAEKMSAATHYPIIKKIFKMDVFQVDERGFYVRIVSNKGKGVAMSLFKALESLTSFSLHTSNLAASAQTYAFTFTLHIMEEGMDVNIDKLEQWIAGVFVNEGFEFETSIGYVL